MSNPHSYTAQLKPCPFCGGAATIKTYPRDRFGLRGCVEVGCENKHCPVLAVVEDDPIEEAVAHWNRRCDGPNSELAEALEILRSIEFATVVAAKCPVCLGWDKRYGEQSRKHTATCKLKALLNRHPATSNDRQKYDKSEPVSGDGSNG